MIKKFILALAILIFSTVNVFAARSDFWSRDWWVTKSGMTDGTVNDIMFTYLGEQGFTGTLNDRLIGWLLLATGETSGDLTSLIIECFETTTSCDDYPVNNGSPGQLTFLGDNLQFIASNLTYNH